MKRKAEIVADSINFKGDRLTSLLITFPRIILSELNTHRALSKNTSSSRAIPFEKMVKAIEEDPFIPIAWQKDHKGMQGTEYISNEDNSRIVEYCIEDWLEARDKAVEMATSLHMLGVTKQICNRLLEPWMWITVLVTGSTEGWENFFKLRCPQYSFGEKTNNPRIWRSRKDAIKDFPDWESKNDLFWSTINKGQAEIHMMALAEAIWDAMNESTPKQLRAGEWHIPFGDKMYMSTLDQQEIYLKHPDIKSKEDLKIRISTAMAARTSYTVIGDEKEIDYDKLLDLYDKLVKQDPLHSSPFEHCARAMNNQEYFSFVKGECQNTEHSSFYGWCNNFKGFIQLRYLIEHDK